MSTSRALRVGGRLFVAVAAFICSQLSPVLAIDQSVSLTEANRAYAAGDYRRSLMYCNFVLAEAPSPLAHYCRANTLVKLGYVAEAKTEYESAMQLAKDDPLRRCCETALAAFKSDGTPRAHYERANALMKSGDNAGAKAEYERTLLSTSDPVLQKYCFSALTAIQAAAINDDVAGTSGVLSAPNAVRLIALQRAAANNEDVVGTSGVLSAPNALRLIAQQRAAVAERISAQASELDHVITKSEYWRFHGDSVTDALKSSSDGLQTQIGSRSTGGVHLLEQGTDLFVRSYAVDQTVNPAHAWISDAATYEKGRFTTPLEATPESLDDILSAASGAKGHRSSRANVFGKILNSSTP